jgi:hypothetical protein
MAENYKGYHGPGISNVGSYQVAGIPFITGSSNLDDDTEHTINFPSVTRSVTVANYSASPIRFSFASKDTGQVTQGLHFWQLDHAVASGSSNIMTMNVKCDQLFVSNASGDDNLEYRVFAELTGIDKGEMFPLSGPGITD